MYGSNQRRNMFHTLTVMGTVTPPIFMLELLQDETLSDPLSNPAFLRVRKHGRRITCRSVVRHFLTIGVIHPSTHNFKQDSMLFISHCYKSTLVQSNSISTSFKGKVNIFANSIIRRLPQINSQIMTRFQGLYEFFTRLYKLIKLKEKCSYYLIRSFYRLNI